jgi:predicted HicB family RNase H-like nuclease
MNTSVSYRGFDGSIIHDAEDHLYHGRILGIRDMVIYHGYTVEEAETIFRQAVDEYITHFEKDGKEPPKPFASLPAHMPHELQVKAALFAHEHHVELESVLNMTLSQFFAQAA